MRLSLAAARKYALIICMHLLAVISMRLLTVLYVHVLFIESKLQQVIWRRWCVPDWECCRRSPYICICKRVRFPTVCEGLQLTREDRNDDCFAACLQV